MNPVENAFVGQFCTRDTCEPALSTRGWWWRRLIARRLEVNVSINRSMRGLMDLQVVEEHHQVEAEAADCHRRSGCIAETWH